MSTTPTPPLEPNRLTALETIMQELLDRIQTLQGRLDEEIIQRQQGVALAAPIGTVVAFTGENVPPSWRLCDGRPLSRSVYPQLYAAIGTIYGEGINPQNSSREGDFNLPDLRGAFLRGTDAGSGRDADGQARTNQVGQTVGPAVGSWQGQSTRMPGSPFVVQHAGQHRHTITLPRVHGRDPGGLNGWGGTNAGSGGEFTGVATEDGWHTHALTGGDNETRPFNICVHWIIKAE